MPDTSNGINFKLDLPILKLPQPKTQNPYIIEWVKRRQDGFFPPRLLRCGLCLSCFRKAGSVLLRIVPMALLFIGTDFMKESYELEEDTILIN